ncbi:MAG TPA: SdpI family protein [Allosphingosinicella sp.]|nr:SdpI family protein [Allosphingosinicella sp.]
MTRNTLAIASMVVVAAMLMISIAVGNGLPSELRLPSHWGMDGQPDQYAPKWVALLLPAGMTGAVSLLFHFLPALEPRREGLERSRGLYLWGWASLLLMGAAIEFAMISTALSWDVRVNGVIIGATGAMLVMIGNQLGKSRSMYLIGIRTPWTLASEEVWVKTHRLAGKLMVGGGFALMVAALVPIPPGMLAPVIVAVIALSAGVPIVYSFLLWRREKEAGQPSA